jgi:hypothetical protein
VTRERLKALLAEYGRVAVWTYLALFVVVLAGFAAAITWGIRVESATSGASVLGAAYVATKLTQPLRIAATLALTPVVAKLVERFSAASARSRPPAAEKSQASKSPLEP